MKQAISIFLVLALAMCLCACTQQEEEFQDPVIFYFLRVQNNPMIYGTDDSVIAPVTREGDGIRSNMTVLLNRYLSYPGTEQLRSPFPAGTSVIAVRDDNGILEITLTDAFAELTGLDLTLACACLTRTVLDLTEAEAVRICVETETLDGRASITMDRDNLVLEDIATQSTNNSR